MPIDRRSLVLIALSVAVVAFGASVVQVHDPDMFHHLALGREIARHGLQAEETFLWPLRGETTGPAPYWLGSLVIYAWYSMFGNGGLAFLPALVGALLALLLLFDSTPRSGKHTYLSLCIAALPLALAVSAFRYRATARPETLGVLFIASTLWALRRAEDGRRGLLLALPAVVLLWTNIHPSVAAGIGLVVLFLGAEVARQGWATMRSPSAGGGNWSGAKRALVVVLIAGAASLASPSPQNPIRLAVSFAAATVLPGGGTSATGEIGAAALPHLQALVKEMKAPGAGEWLRPHGLLILLTAGSFALRWRAVRARELATFLVLAFLATRAQRFMVLFAIVSVPFAARNLGEALACLPLMTRWAGLRRVGMFSSGVLAVAAIGLPVAYPAPGLAFGTTVRRGAYPVRAVEYLKAIGFSGRLYNSFSFGGYLAWQELEPFQDGRGLTPAGLEQAVLLGPSSPSTFRGLDQAYRFDALILAHPKAERGRAKVAAGGDWLVPSRLWALVAFDDGGLLYVRRDGVAASFAARDEYRWARPAYAPYDWSAQKVPLLLAEYRRSVVEVPDCIMCRYFHGAAALAAGRFEEALETSMAVLGTDEPGIANVLRTAARSSEALGRSGQARGFYERLLRTGEDDDGARRGLARIAMTEGDLDRALGYLRPILEGEGPRPEDLTMALDLARRGGDAAETARLEMRLQDLRREESSREMRRRGMEAYEAGNVAAAVDWFRKAVQAWEASPGAHSELGQALLGLGQVDQAIWHQRRATDLDPSYVPAHFGLGLAFASRGDRGMAAAQFRRCIELEPNGAWASAASEQLRSLGSK